MRWTWAAATAVLICGTYYLLVSKVLRARDLIILRQPDVRFSQFAKAYFDNNNVDTSIVKPKLLNNEQHKRLKRSDVNANSSNNHNTNNYKSNNGGYDSTTTAVNNANKTISINLSESLIASLLTQDYYLYRMNLFGDEVVINLTRLTNDRNVVFAPNFILQHLDTNYTWITPNSTNVFVDHCMYTGRIVGNSTTIDDAVDEFSSSWRGSILLNLCRGMYGVLELPQGTYFLEPLLDFGNDQTTTLVPDDQPHLLYRHRSHTFHDYSASRSMYPVLYQRNISENTSDDHSSAYFQFAHRGHHRRKKSTSWDHYVEVLVVADAQMRRYHRNNLENYVLTLLSIVATIYRHPSLEAAMNIVVVRLVVLDHENAGPKITENAQETLKHFCRWQQTLNDDDDNSINHHDVAILLTRHDICRAPGKCDTLGLAELGTMCDTYRSCAIIEDNGLSAAFTIAHELGHIFNIPHDDERKCSQYMSLDKYNFHIMAPTLEYNTHPWSWSPCSAHLLHRFLDSEKAWCLFDKPVQQTYSQQMVTNPTPGMNFSVNQQCQYVFGPSSQLCPFMPTCKRLWCTNVYSYQMQAGCRTQHMPWADGTPCAYNKWCYRGECVPISPDQLTPVDGGWGEWKEWGECSRTCGGGVERAIRDCDNPRPIYGGKYCIGERVRYRSCNLKECPNETPDFREVQCSEFDGDRHNVPGVGANVKWVPRYNGINANDRCKLYCTVKGSSDFYLLKTKVVDGTPCGRDTDDICVDGICREAGCDFQLGSYLKRDECGICGGDGKTCRKETGNFNGETTYGYNSVIKIPAGVNNLDIRQKSWNNRNEDDNYLALLNSKGEFILNGHFQVTVFRQQIRVRGAVLEYSGSDTVVERINTSKPLMEDLFLHVLAVGQLMPPNVNWEYMIHDTTLALSSRVLFEWRASDYWTPCDSRCHGSQVQKLVCVQTSDNQPSDDRNCENSRKTDVRQRVCNLHCQLKWSVEVIAPCSAVCGTGEITQRPFCVEILSNGEENRIDDDNCRDLDRPLHVVSCYRDCAGRHWVYSEWDSCSQTCGGGVQRREAHCYDETKKVLEDRYCESITIEPTERQCTNAPCPIWHYEEWSKCSQSCDGGIQMRIVACRDSSGRDVDDRHCNAGELLEDRRKCNEHLCTKWKFETWSECSQTCGDAVATRSVTCVDSKGNILNDNMCVAAQKLATKHCKLPPCPQWRLGEWSSCSQTCLDGWSSRRVECVDSTGEPLELKFCGTIDEIPPAHKHCNLGSCPSWRIQEWSTCSVTCGVGHQDRVVECVYKNDVVNTSHCANSTEAPLKRQSCAAIRCPEWEVGPWETCSATCGEGYQHRVIRCAFPDSRQPADSKLCDKKYEPKSIMACILSICPTPTIATTRTSTSTTLTTAAFISSRIIPVTLPSTTTPFAKVYHADPSTSAAHYTHSKQSTVYADHSQNSPTRWETGAWSECSVTCGQGEQMRYVACRDIFYRILPDPYCSHLAKPHGAEHCVRNTCGEWHVGDWDPCSATCGEGHKSTRPVTCVAPSTENVLEWSYCDPDKRPVSERTCNLPQCYDHPTNNDIATDVTESSWRVGEWGHCSQTCGSGWQQRLVLCVPGVGTGPIVYCPLSEKPVALRPCAQQSCPKWLFGDWGQCNRTCGGGYRQRVVECVNPDDGKVIPWNNCSQQMPARIQKCNLHKCRHHGIWKIGKWSLCSSVCGRGVRTRKVECIDEEIGFVYRNEAFCPQEKPAERHRCRMARCPRWKRGKWSVCSVSCGEGIRNRQVYCTQGRKNIVSNKKCGNLTKPADTSHCRQPACPTYHWVTSHWSRCSEQCGNGRQVREVYCVNNSYTKTLGACNSLKRPSAVQSCVGPKCPYEWSPGPWTTCSRSCDDGEQFRNLRCRIKSSLTSRNVSLAESGTVVTDYYCRLLPKPAVKLRCNLGACESDTFWQTDQWSDCSVTCGWGLQQRKIYCSNKNNTRLSRMYCANITSKIRPRRRRRCFARNCDPSNCAEVKEVLNATADSLYDIVVGGRSVKIFCYAMSTSTPLEYLPLPSGPHTNYAEIYGKRLMFPFTCPDNGSRNDSCYCTNKGNPNPGLTRYSQIRVDLYHMKINLMDGQFAVTEFGDFIPYATAGDCYSAANCPQARFSVDLRGTGFKVAEKTTWREEGHRVTTRINRMENGAVVHGVCGGYCGKCYPDRSSGLEIELDSEHF